MGIRLTGSTYSRCLTRLNWAGLGGVAATALVLGLANGAMAQTAGQPRGSLTTVDINVNELPTVQEEFLNTYFTQDKNWFTNQRFPRTFWPIFGIVENDIGGDGRHVYNMYRELFNQQTAGVPIRVADAPNPFTGSLATTPLYVEEPIPPAPVPSFAPPPPDRNFAPSAAPSETRESIPALW